MSENLSKQLCEICGLKYCKEKVVINEGQCPNVDIKPFYLNFEQPENFVRLFNLTLPIRGIPSIAEFVTFEYLTITDSKDFLEKLIKSIQEPYTEDEVIKSIREAEWVYD